jgi:mannose-6-phosphate isomerase-like protein (cupin superfamily)
MPAATTRLLQLKEPLAQHVHANLDEVLYVVAGEGGIKMTGESVAGGPGSMLTIPRGTQHAIERRGRNPLIMLSVLAGAPCPTQALTATSRR